MMNTLTLLIGYSVLAVVLFLIFSSLIEDTPKKFRIISGLVFAVILAGGYFAAPLITNPGPTEQETAVVSQEEINDTFWWGVYAGCTDASAVWIKIMTGGIEPSDSDKIQIEANCTIRVDTLTSRYGFDAPLPTEGWEAVWNDIKNGEFKFEE